MNQENNDIANKYGVVTFETAKKLNWKEETNFLYLGTSQLTLEECMDKKEIKKPLKFRLCIPIIRKDEKFEHKMLYCLENNEEYPDYRHKGSQEFYYAPQMHEIAKLIPYEITEECFYYRLSVSEHSERLFLSYKDIEANYEFEYEEDDITDFIRKFVLDGVEVSGKHYAEAYAKMYLLLRENGVFQRYDKRR